MLRKTWI